MGEETTRIDDSRISPRKNQPVLLDVLPGIFFGALGTRDGTTMQGPLLVYDTGKRSGKVNRRTPMQGRLFDTREDYLFPAHNIWRYSLCCTISALVLQAVHVSSLFSRGCPWTEIKNKRLLVLLYAFLETFCSKHEEKKQER